MNARLLCTSIILLAAGCKNDPAPVGLAEGIYGPLGSVMPSASEEQKATFERGRQVALRRFTPETGLGPEFNVTFCASCHEKPVTGGGGPRYRNFYLAGTELSDGSFLPAGKAGVVNTYSLEGQRRPPLDEGVNRIAQRNAIPFWGVGLIAELPEKSILANADPDDRDGDGISGRPNYDRGFVGRFGRKAQTVSIEGFIRGPLNNHAGITSDPLSEEDKARLPVPSETLQQSTRDPEALVLRQAAAPEEPLTDEDEVADPELASEDLFDLVSFAMLLAVPEPAAATPASERGQINFAAAGCEGCHTPSLVGPRGRIPLYSDLLLHDMGSELADGIVAELASGAEYRSHPLWGIAAGAPYLHDGRADTMDEAIRLHGGEGQAAADAYSSLSEDEREDLLEFLDSLGGADEASEGLLPPDAPVASEGEAGAPRPGLSEAELTHFLAGRALFDLDFPQSRGLGPKFNGDSCRACHFDPVIGGAGPSGVDVTRHGSFDGSDFTDPQGGTILHKLTSFDVPRPEPTSAHNVFEARQTPSIFGAGLIESIADADIIAGEDPTDADGDGISGVAHVLPDTRLGRFGWKAQVPSLREFVRDAMTAELGITVPDEPNLSYGGQADADAFPDPEISSQELDDITFFMAQLAPLAPTAMNAQGRSAFDSAGCDDCHTPELPGAGGPVPLYSDLLLHDVRTATEPSTGIPDNNALAEEFRTPPLWGISRSAPYMHDGRASTAQAAIEAHAGEATQSVTDFMALSGDDQAALIAFLESL